jgi:GNAT superfamily N-acetyltransferase
MYDGLPTILDQINFIHGPRDLLARYVAFADHEMREFGVRIRISRDFARLAAIHKQNRDSCPNLSPVFDPECSTLTNENAYWIEALDEFGDTVMTSAGRLFDHGKRSVADDLRALRVLYDDPAPQIASGARVKVTAPTAERLYGRIMYSGAVWVRPDYRRHGFAKIVPRLNRAYAITLWNVSMFWATIEPRLHEMGVTRAYNSWNVEDGIVEHIPSWRGELKLLFLSMNQTTLLRDLATSLSATTSNSRRIDSAIASSPSGLEERQGMSTRS